MRLSIARRLALVLLIGAAVIGRVSAPPIRAAAAVAPVAYDVRAFGAKGDGRTLDTAAVNKAIAAAHAAGGGTVRFAAGTYLSYSIHLQSHVTLQLESGATLLAAAPSPGQGYDAAEPNAWDKYQDFGHSHWHNSLIWGEQLEDVAIIGPGRIYGKGLTRTGDVTPGVGNKTIALKLCRNVIIRDVTILQAGHFGILATGVDNLTIDNVKIDTNRDGMNIDACRNVRISNCSVNSPDDDGICLKSSYGLGVARATENVTITNSQVSGYDMGTFLDGTFKRTVRAATDKDGPTGRIKFGTESNGGFKNITISNIVFDHCRGLAIESVDGAIIEDVSITNITMREVGTAPIFIRLGNRARGPEAPPVGAIRRVDISHVTVSGADPRYASIISGIPGHPIEAVRLQDIRVVHKGGGTAEDAALQPPEQETAYPEPSMFGKTPAYGLYARHVRGLELRDVEMSVEAPDQRPPVALRDVVGAVFDHVIARRAEGVPFFALSDVRDLEVRNSPGADQVARDPLGDWPAGASPAEVGRRVAENFAARPFERPTAFIIYPEVCAWYGSLEVAQLTGDKDLQARLVRKFDPLWTPDGAKNISPQAHVDYRVFGVVPLEIYLQTREQRFLDFGRGFADRQWETTTPDGITTEARYWIDDMFMITAVQVQAFRATGDAKYLDRAALAMVAYLDKLQQPNGLFFHAPDSPFYWSRGNGWMAAGAAELLRSLPDKHPGRPRILEGYRKMMATLLSTQGDDGLWRQLIDHAEAWPETSGTGMFTFAMATGVRNGWLDRATYAPAVRKAWIGLTKYIDAAGNISNVCAGTNKGPTVEYYLTRPRNVGDLHGQAPVLWTAAALLR
jgi:polygalacturonase/rhamnogalacturonyl hydrolase YesR